MSHKNMLRSDKLIPWNSIIFAGTTLVQKANANSLIMPYG